MNQKGGVGKTTVTANLGAALGRLGKQVLLFDLDPQANLSIHLDVNIHELEVSIYDVLVGEKGIADAVLVDLLPGVSMVPANIDLSGAEVELVNAVGRETLLRDALNPYLNGHNVDYVFFDCPPSLGILSLNALAAAEEVFIPIQTEFFALQGLAKLLGVIELIARRLNRQLHLSRVIPTLYDTRTSLSKEVLADIKTHFGDSVTRTVIRKNVRLAEAPSHGRTILEYAPSAVGSRDFMGLAHELLEDEEQGRLSEAAAETHEEGTLRPEPEAPEQHEAEMHVQAATPGEEIVGEAGPEEDAGDAAASPPAPTTVRRRFIYLRRRQCHRAPMHGMKGARPSSSHMRVRRRVMRRHAPTRQPAFMQLTPA